MSCKKDKVPEPCTGVSMSGERAVFQGKWRWYKTWVTEWFDMGSDIILDYTPQSEGFEYYFTISSDGRYQGYRDGLLVDNFIMSNVQYEYFMSSDRNVMTLDLNCTNEKIRLGINNPITNNDSIDLIEYPFNFNDPANHLYSNINFFVRE